MMDEYAKNQFRVFRGFRGQKQKQGVAYVQRGANIQNSRCGF